MQMEMCLLNWNIKEMECIDQLTKYLFLFQIKDARTSNLTLANTPSNNSGAQRSRYRITPWFSLCIKKPSVFFWRIKVKIRAFPHSLQGSCGKQSGRVSSLLYISISFPQTAIVKPAVSVTLRTFCRLTWSNFSLSNFSLIHFSLSETTTAIESAVSHLPPRACVDRRSVWAIWDRTGKGKR